MFRLTTGKNGLKEKKKKSRDKKLTQSDLIDRR